MATKTKLQGAAAQRERMGAVGTFDGWRVLPENIHSPRSDPSHDEYESWLERTDPNHPKTAALINAMREHGTDEGEPIIVFTDGGVTTIADGDRRRSEKDAAGEWRNVECVVALVTVAKVGARVRCERLPGYSHGLEFYCRDGQRWIGYGATDGCLRERRPGDEAALKVAALREKRKEAEYQRNSLAGAAQSIRENAVRRMIEADEIDTKAATYAAERDRLDAEINATAERRKAAKS